jgi:hypothetical protein
MEPFLSYVVICAIICVGATAAVVMKLRPPKQTANIYQIFFVMGTVFIPIGVLTANVPLAVIGIFYSIIGLSHRKEWDQPCMAEIDTRTMELLIAGLTAAVVFALGVFLFAG